MNDLPKNDVLKNLKQQFLNGNLVEYDHKYEKTVASWEKSRAAGADAHLRIICRARHIHRMLRRRHTLRRRKNIGPP